MGILEEVIQMKNSGKPENEIINSLQQKGFSPKSVKDALSQAKIKNAVSDAESEDNMQLSIMTQPQEENISQPQQEIYTPRTKESEEQMYAPQEQFYPQQNYYPQESYDYSPSAGNDSDTIIEISEQVFSKNIKKLAKQIEQLNEFKTLSQAKIDGMSERLKRIETVIDRLQISILDKIGSYGQNIEGIKKEMSMMQDSFSKVINPLTDKKTSVEKKIEKDSDIKKTKAKKK